MSIQLETWNNITNSERVDIAIAVRKALPVPCAFSGIRNFKQGEHENTLAVFSYECSEFVLIPGHTVNLGYSWERPFVLTVEEAELWKITQEEFETDISFDEYLEEILTPPRTVSLSAFLLETQLKRLEEKKKIKRGTKKDAATSTEHSRVKAQLASQGFRLPTSDEWEYACGAGATTLYRWGDQRPLNRGPSEDKDGQHAQPNAFGLSIANHPRNWEPVDEPGIMRGGDGGGISCGGGIPFMIEWLVLATAYFDQDHYHRQIFGGDVRRAVSIEL